MPIRVESSRLAYGGICFAMTRVPSPADIQLAQTIASSKIPDGSKVILS
jgi:hypothetical protein